MQAGNISDPGNGMYHEQLDPSLSDVKPKATKRSCKNKLGGPRSRPKSSTLWTAGPASGEDSTG